MLEFNIICRECKKSFNLPKEQSEGFCIYCGTKNTAEQYRLNNSEVFTKYIKETDPFKRREIIDSALEKCPEDNDWIARDSMWQLRYKINKRSNKLDSDMFLAFWQTLIFHSSRVGATFGQRYAKKEIIKFMEDPLLKKILVATQTDLIYEEMYNSVRLYINCCLSDSHYNSTIMDMVKMSREKVNEKMENQLFKCSVLLLEYLNLDKTYGVIIKAAQDAFSDIISPVRWIYT